MTKVHICKIKHINILRVTRTRLTGRRTYRWHSSSPKVSICKYNTCFVLFHTFDIVTPFSCKFNCCLTTFDAWCKLEREEEKRRRRRRRRTKRRWKKKKEREKSQCGKGKSLRNATFVQSSSTKWKKGTTNKETKKQHTSIHWQHFIVTKKFRNILFVLSKNRVMKCTWC